GDDNAAAEAAARAGEEEAAAVAELEKMGAVHGESGEAPVGEAQAAEQRRLSIAAQIMKLSIARKIEWANKKGTKEVRTILLRDPNKLGQMAGVQSPRITEAEITNLAKRGGRPA